jgi:hypothetical protein
MDSEVGQKGQKGQGMGGCHTPVIKLIGPTVTTAKNRKNDPLDMDATPAGLTPRFSIIIMNIIPSVQGMHFNLEAPRLESNEESGFRFTVGGTFRAPSSLVDGSPKPRAVCCGFRQAGSAGTNTEWARRLDLPSQLSSGIKIPSSFLFFLHTCRRPFLRRRALWVMQLQSPETITL